MTYEAPLSLHVLSGFLGSGKTTVLTQWLAQQNLNDIALLVNEFGEVGIDHHLLNEVAPDTILLPSGCVCCQIRGELKTALLDLYERRARGELPPFTQVILETTGLADPAPILSTLLHDRQLKYHFVQGVLVTLVDAVYARMQAASQPEWLAQVTAADRLLISKTDLISATEKAQLVTWLREINPTAEPEDSHLSLAHPESLFRKQTLQGTAQQRFRWLGACAQPDFIQHRPGGALQHPLTETCVITLEPSLNWTAFAIWLSMLLHRHGGTVLRLKGILRVSDSPYPLVIQGVQHTLHPPEHMKDWPGELDASRLVFILRGLSAEQLKRAFERYIRSLS